MERVIESRWKVVKGDLYLDCVRLGVRHFLSSCFVCSNGIRLVWNGL